MDGDQGQGGRARRAVPQGLTVVGGGGVAPAAATGGQTMDLVVGIDSSTTSTKAIALDRDGRAVAEGPGRRADAQPRPGPVRAERRGLVALARRGAGRPVPAGRPGARGGARDQQPARDRGLPRRRVARSSARRSCGSTSAAAPTSTCWPRRSAARGSAASPARPPTRRRPCSACTGCALRARILAPARARGRRARLPRLPAHRHAGDELGQRRSARRPRPDQPRAISPEILAALGIDAGHVLPAGAPGHGHGRGHRRGRGRDRPAAGHARRRGRRRRAGVGPRHGDAGRRAGLPQSRHRRGLGRLGAGVRRGRRPSARSPASPARATSTSSACAPAPSSPTGR